jgi:hypothetical protein
MASRTKIVRSAGRSADIPVRMTWKHADRNVRAPSSIESEKNHHRVCQVTQKIQEEPIPILCESPRPLWCQVLHGNEKCFFHKQLFIAMIDGVILSLFYNSALLLPFAFYLLPS